MILQTPRKYMLSALRQAAWMLFPPQRDLVHQAERLQAWAQFARQQACSRWRTRPKGPILHPPGAFP